MLTTVIHQNAKEVTGVIPLSNSSISRHNHEMTADVDRQLVSKLRVNEFSLPIAESTFSNNLALLMAFVRFLDADDLYQEMFFALKLATDITNESILKK